MQITGCKHMLISISFGAAKSSGNVTVVAPQLGLPFANRETLVQDQTGDDDILLVRLVLIMVTEYDLYLGGAAPRPCCLQPWRAMKILLRLAWLHYDRGVCSHGGSDTLLYRSALAILNSFTKGSPRIDNSGFGGLHQTLNCSSSLQEGIKVMVICLRRISYSKLPNVNKSSVLTRRTKTSCNKTVLLYDFALWAVAGFKKKIDVGIAYPEIFIITFDNRSLFKIKAEYTRSASCMEIWDEIEVVLSLQTTAAVVTDVHLRRCQNMSRHHWKTAATDFVDLPETTIGACLVGKTPPPLK
ncbi:hypothetical protein Tco_0586920 [Tanacetum coccineum]